MPRDAEQPAPAARPAALGGDAAGPPGTRVHVWDRRRGRAGRSGGRPGDPLFVPAPPGGDTGTRGQPHGSPRVVPGGLPLPPPCPLPGPRFPPRSCMPAGPALPAAAAAAPRPAAVSLANKDPAEDKLRQHQRRLPSLSVGPGVCHACRQHGAERDGGGLEAAPLPGRRGQRDPVSACPQEGSRVPSLGSVGRGPGGAAPLTPRPAPPRRPRPLSPAPPLAPEREL